MTTALTGVRPGRCFRAMWPIRAVSGEFAYATQGIRKGGGGSSEPENLNALTDTADMVVALDRLQAMAPKVESVSLVVAWFGDDLRAGNCKVRPGVEVTAKSRRRRPGPSMASAGPMPFWSAAMIRIARLWWHARRLRRGAGDPGDEGARAAGDLLSVHPDGCAARQHAAEPVFRLTPPRRPARLPLAGADHLFACGGLCRERGQDRYGRHASVRTVRCGDAASFSVSGSRFRGPGHPATGVCAAWCCITPISARRRAGSMPS